MSQYAELVKALRERQGLLCYGEGACPENCELLMNHGCYTKLHMDAAAAIEALQVEKAETGDEGMSENRWGVTLEIFMNESVPRVSPVCPRCHKTYYAWSDVEDYCTRCGAKLDGRARLLSDYFSGRVGDYERDKKLMKERYGVDI